MHVWPRGRVAGSTGPHPERTFVRSSTFTNHLLHAQPTYVNRDWITFILWGVVSAIVGGLFGVLYWQQASENWRNLLGLLFSGAFYAAVVRGMGFGGSTAGMSPG